MVKHVRFQYNVTLSLYFFSVPRGRAGVPALHQALSQAPGHSGPALGKLKSKEEGRQTASEQSSQRVGNAMEKRKHAPDTTVNLYGWSRMSVMEW